MEKRRNMEQKVILLNVFKSKKGKTRVAVGFKLQGDNQKGYSYSENWYPSELVDYDYISKHLLEEVVAKVDFVDNFDGSARKVVTALATLTGELILEEQ